MGHALSSRAFSMSSSSKEPQQSFGERLRFLRLRQRLTQRELARAVGYSDAHINRFEKGLYTPNPEIVVARFLEPLGIRHNDEDAIALIRLAARGVAKQQASAAFNGHIQGHPGPPTPLLGRDKQLAHLLNMLADPEVRLLTLLGPPGIGKTRLALGLGDRAAAAFRDGVVFVSLADVEVADLIVATAFRDLSLDATSKPSQAQLCKILAQRNQLVILDNLEQLVNGADRFKTATLLAELVAAAPECRFLATSRAIVHARCETVYEVPPLEHRAACALFEMRARSGGAALKASDSETHLVSEICRKLDDLPLAIELAASRARLFSLPQILERLSSRLTFLTIGAQDLPPRQRSLQATIDWSYRLLSGDEQTTVCVLAVFHDGAPLSIVESVAVSFVSSAVVDLIQTLADQSLIYLDQAQAEPRIRLLESVHEFACARLLEHPKCDLIRDAHAAWVAGIPDEGPASMGAAGGFAHLSAELGNLQAALSWLLSSSKIHDGLKLTIALTNFWRTCGPLQVGLQWLKRFLDHPHAQNYSSDYAYALRSAHGLVWDMGDTDAARRCLEDALTIFQATGDVRGQAWTFADLACMAWSNGSYHEACALAQTSGAFFRDLSEPLGLLWALTWLGSAKRDLGLYGDAYQHFGEVRTISQASGSVPMKWLAINGLATTALRAGDAADALTYGEEGLSVSNTAGLENSVGYAQMVLGQAHLLNGAVDQAATLLERAVLRHRDEGLQLGLCLMVHELGIARHLQGRTDEALCLLSEAARIQAQLGRRLQFSESLDRLGWIAVDQGQFDHAVQLMGAAERLREQLGAPCQAWDCKVRDRCLERARSALGDSAYCDAVYAGKAMSEMQMLVCSQKFNR